MDFTQYIIDDIVKYHIFSIERDIHFLIMCKSVNKTLYKAVCEILQSFTFFKDIQSCECIHQSIGPLLSGFRTLCLTSKNYEGQLQTTYHYIVNGHYDCKYNYHFDGQYGCEWLRLICYDGLILTLIGHGSNILITLGTCMSCFYKLDNINTNYLGMRIISGSTECRYTCRPLHLF